MPDAELISALKTTARLSSMFYNTMKPQAGVNHGTIKSFENFTTLANNLVENSLMYADQIYNQIDSELLKLEGLEKGKLELLEGKTKQAMDKLQVFTEAAVQGLFGEIKTDPVTGKPIIDP